MLKFTEVCLAGFALFCGSPSIAHGQNAVAVIPGANSKSPASDVSATSILPDQEKSSETADTAKPPDKMAALEQTLDAISKNLTITTGDPNIKMVLGGTVDLDFLFSAARQVAPGTPFFLTSGPIAGFHQQTFDANARPSTVFAFVSGPEFGSFQSSAVIMACFYSSSLIQDLYGLLPVQAYAQLKNDDWRFAAGLQFDIFNPLNPTVLPFSYLAGSGNAGAGFPAQFRVERYFHPDDETQITLTAGLSDPLPTTVNNQFTISEDNGWPNVECRAALALGELTGEGPLAKRPFELGVSGVVGQIRTTTPFVTQVVANIWGLGSDLRWAVTERFGVQGEFFVGQTLGVYTAGILQNVNAVTFAGVHATGGWVELYYYLCPEKLHTHWGYGIDDPLNRDLAPGQPLRNDTWFANLIWDIGKHFRTGIEFTYRKTAYSLVPNNEGFGVETQVQFKF